MKKTQLSNPELDRSHVRKLVWVNQLKNNNNIENNIPLLFKKKISKNLVMKPLTYIRSDTGKTRHFTPAAQE